MTNKIKEILDNLDFNVNHTSNWVEPLGLDKETWKILLDYINDLQEDNDYLEKRNNFLNSACNGFSDKNKDLQTRIDKAVEYINKFESIRAYYEYEDCGYTEYNYDEDFKQDLLEILRGEE